MKKRISNLIAANFKESKTMFTDKDSEDYGGFISIIIDVVFFVIYFFLLFTYYPFERFIIKSKISPFIKEWILAFVKWSWVGPLVFLFGLIIHAEGPITEGILYCLVQIPLAILGLITLFMPTPRRELEDMLFGRKLRKRKKVMIGSVETFRTVWEPDYDERFEPISTIYDLGGKAETIFPLRLFCAELPEGHVPRSSAPKFDLSFTLRIDPEEEPELAEAERNDLILSNFAVTEQELKQWKIRPKMALSESGVEAFTALAEAEPSMEFEVEYLFFSRLLTAIRPIEGYDCPDTVTDLLEKITKAANPWIKK